MRDAFTALCTAIIVILCSMACPAAAADNKLDLKALAARKMPALLEFGRGWCIPCKYMKPILEDMSRAYAGRALVTTVDMDANKMLVKEFRVRMMPTQVFLTADGKEFFRHEGTLEREQIAEVFAKMGVASQAAGPAPITVPGHPGSR
jgi:thioredoxin 1